MRLPGIAFGHLRRGKARAALDTVGMDAGATSARFGDDSPAPRLLVAARSPVRFATQFSGGSLMRSATLPLLLLAVVVGLSTSDVRAQAAATVTLKGQVTCSSCWFEADRETTPYGSDADTKCAIRCAKGGVPGALAVTGIGETMLYLLESGTYTLGDDGKNWTDHTGHFVEVTGTIRKESGKQFVKVDSLKVLPASS